MLTRPVIVVGGSYVGINVAQQLAANAKVNTQKAFIPFKPGVFANAPPGSGDVVQAAVTDLTDSHVTLDRAVQFDGQQLDRIPYSYLVMATGTKLRPPSNVLGSEKLDGVKYLRRHAESVQKSKRMVVIGGGAVGVQLATDAKELYPEKSITLVHSRDKVMNRFHPKLHQLIEERCKELGIDLVLGSRVKLPSQGYPTSGEDFEVELLDGRRIPSDFAVICNGQTPQSEILKPLSPQCIDAHGFIRMKKTLQVDDDEHQNVFALGDIAATAAHKAARPALRQAEIARANVIHSIAGEPLEDYEVTDPAAIHLTLGITKNVIFRNPLPGSDEPVIIPKDDGKLDMGIDAVWERRGGGPDPML
ncbi:FAD/NAD(P)-binding domain-containing protein [Hortaea werneckii]|nr:FAD/NAD(P)-binding domain-containing protein [Hortaea werneckii]KAI7537017.1 FAD/NAD(P)-binding domain-containing protein [Hortaea werneckii]